VPRKITCRLDVFQHENCGATLQLTNENCGFVLSEWVPHVKGVVGGYGGGGDCAAQTPSNRKARSRMLGVNKQTRLIHITFIIQAMNRSELFLFWYFFSTFGSIILTIVIFRRPYGALA